MTDKGEEIEITKAITNLKINCSQLSVIDLRGFNAKKICLKNCQKEKKIILSPVDKLKSLIINGTHNLTAEDIIENFPNIRHIDIYGALNKEFQSKMSNVDIRYRDSTTKIIEADKTFNVKLLQLHRLHDREIKEIRKASF